MPAYNVAAFLGAAIESVCSQTFTDFEILVIDDGATDDTPAVASAWAARDSRVRVFRQENGGISSARNHALRLARGEFIAILDSDDMWAPTFLEWQMGILERRPDVDIVTGNAFFMGSALDGHPARPWPDHRPQPDLKTIITDEQAVFIMSVFRRRVYDTIGGFDDSMRSNEDYDYWLRAATAGFRFVRNDRPLGHYRRRDDSLSASEVRMVRGILRVYNKLRPALADRPEELALVDAQIERFATQRLVAEARAALETGDMAVAGEHLAALYDRTGRTAILMARLMARWTPGLLSTAFQMRRARLALRH
jgi:glycosyltransferase involved in cell wall biosynthesis